MDDRDGHLPAQQGPGEELPHLPGPDRRAPQAARARPGGAGVHARRRHRRRIGGAQRDPGRHAAGGRSGSGDVRDAARPGADSRAHGARRLEPPGYGRRSHGSARLGRGEGAALHRRPGGGAVPLRRRRPAVRLQRGDGGRPVLRGDARLQRPAHPDHHRVAVLRRQALARDDAQPQRERSAPPRLRQPRRHREADRQQRGDLLDPGQAGRAPQGSAPGDARQHLAAHRDPRRRHGARVRLRQHRQLHLPPGRPGQELPPLRRGAEVRLRPLRRPQGAVRRARGAHQDRGLAGGALGGGQPGGQPGPHGPLGVLERPQVGRAGAHRRDGRLGPAGELQLPRLDRRVHAQRRGAVRPPAGHAGDRGGRPEEPLDPRPHQLRQLRRAGQLRADRTELGVQGRPSAAPALPQVAGVQVRPRAEAGAVLPELQRLPVPRSHRRPQHPVRLLPALPARPGRDARLLPGLRPEAPGAVDPPLLRAGRFRGGGRRRPAGRPASGRGRGGHRPQGAPCGLGALGRGPLGGSAPRGPDLRVHPLGVRELRRAQADGEARRLRYRGVLAARALGDGRLRSASGAARGDGQLGLRPERHHARGGAGLLRRVDRPELHRRQRALPRRAGAVGAGARRPDARAAQGDRAGGRSRDRPAGRGRQRHLGPLAPGGELLRLRAGRAPLHLRPDQGRDRLRRRPQGRGAAHRTRLAQAALQAGRRRAGERGSQLAHRAQAEHRLRARRHQPVPGHGRRRSRDGRGGEAPRNVRDQEPRSRHHRRGLRAAGAGRLAPGGAREMRAGERREHLAAPGAQA